MSTTKTSQAGRFLLAIEAIKKGQSSSIQTAATLYEVPHSTLTHCISSHTAWTNSEPQNQKLTSVEESVLIQWIISMDEWGQPPQVATVWEIANLLLSNWDNSTTPKTVGKCWVKWFIDCHPELETQFSQLYNYKQALCEDPKVIWEWFELVQNTIQKYRIVQENIYKLDKTGFQMGIIGTAKIVTGLEKTLKPKLLQSENSEWVIIVEGVNATGWTLPPMIILKKKLHQAF